MIDYLSSLASGYDGNLHLVSSMIALASGPAIFLNKKGTNFHKLVGYIFFTTMLLVNTTALAKYDLTGTFNLFHFVAIINLITVLAAGFFLLTYKLRQQPKDIVKHGIFMVWTYYGLFVALIAEVVTRGIPSILHGTYGWEKFGIFLLCLMGVLGYICYRIMRIQIRPFIQASESRKV